MAAKATSEGDPAPVAGTGTTGQVLAAPVVACATSPTNLVTPPS